MGLSFTGVRPHPPTPCIQRGLQGSSTNEAAGISLARYKLLCVKPFSWLEAAPSTSYYFTEWKGFTINDAIMLMELPSCLFASPSTKYQSWWRMRKCKHHCTNSECISAHESELSLEMEALETINNWLGNNRALVHCHLLSFANLSIGRQAKGILLRSNQILDLKIFNLILMVWWHLCIMLLFSACKRGPTSAKLTFYLYWVCLEMDGPIETIFLSFTITRATLLACVIFRPHWHTLTSKSLKEIWKSSRDNICTWEWLEFTL